MVQFHSMGLGLERRMHEQLKLNPQLWTDKDGRIDYSRLYTVRVRTPHLIALTSPACAHLTSPHCTHTHMDMDMVTSLHLISCTQQFPHTHFTSCPAHTGENGTHFTPHVRHDVHWMSP